MNQLAAMPRASVWIEGDRIDRVEACPSEEPPPQTGPGCLVIDAQGRVVMPAFVDCHTHACWAGNRIDEWERMTQGTSYLDILKAGGGILATVRAVRQSSQEELAERLLVRLDHMFQHGTTVAEIKSGYGLSTESELKMLRAIVDAGRRWPGLVVPTACLGHALAPEMTGEQFVNTTIRETLPAVSQEFPGVTIDAYCEQGAWSLEDCLRLFDTAQQLGHPVRVHADQFTSTGMIPEAIRRGYVSVDHLEAARPEDLRRLASSPLFGVMLPCSAFHLKGRYADGRGFVDQGGALAIATNYNPGSAPCPAIPLAIALATRRLGLTPAEAIVAATANAAALLALPDRGAIAPGRRADLIVLRHQDERQLAFEFGGNPVEQVICGGRTEFIPF